MHPTKLLAHHPCFLFLQKHLSTQTGISARTTSSSHISLLCINGRFINVFIHLWVVKAALWLVQLAQKPSMQRVSFNLNVHSADSLHRFCIITMSLFQSFQTHTRTFRTKHCASIFKATSILLSNSKLVLASLL